MDAPRSGAKWLRCDLHVHTPFDGEKKFGVDVKGALAAFRKERPERLRRIARDFVDACCRAEDGAGIDIVALTDHNSIEGYRSLRPFFDELRTQAQDAGDPMPVILPGVELSAGGERSIHFLVIFAADTEPHLIDRAIGHVFGARDRFDGSTGAPLATGQSVEDFLTKLYDFCRPTSGERSMEMIVLPAHADSNSGVMQETAGELASGGEVPGTRGLWDEMKGHLRQRVVTRRDWHGFQTRKPYSKLPQPFQDLLAQWAAARQGDDWKELSAPQRNEIRARRHWPLVEASDPHSYDAIGKRYTWLKMEVPDVEGIRLSLLDPESRLRRMSDGPPREDYPRITRLRIRNTDFFETLDVPLSSCLTSMIGGRGSGKSSVLELMRYALARDRKEDFGDQNEKISRKQVETLLKTKSARDFGESEGILLPDHEVSVDLIVADQEYRVSRTQNGLTIVRNPDRDGEEVVDLDVRTLIKPRILSQRQISRIARDPAAQRRELDAHIDPDALREFETHRRELTANIRNLQLSRDNIEKKLSSLPSRKTELQNIKSQIAYLEQGDRREVFERFQLRDREKRWLEEQLKTLREMAAELEHRADDLLEGLPSSATRPATLDGDTWIASADRRTNNIVRDTAGALRAQALRIREHVQALESEQEQQWKPGYEAARESYETLRDELERRGIDFGQHRKLLQQRAMIEEEVSELEKSHERLARILEDLESAREELANLHGKRFGWRRDCAEALKEADADVRLEVQPFQDRSQLNEAAQQWFAGSGLREADRETLLDFLLDDGDAVVRRLGDLARAFRADISAGAGDANISPEQTNTARVLGDAYREKLSGHFWKVFSNGSRIQLDEMEHFVPDDLVTMRARGPDGGFKPITQGSLGQRSTAILSLVLFSGNQPLIVDQPEDDLDNKYIYDVVVELLRQRKFSRQIVVATHNANIPVNGDAELIVALEVPPGQRTGGLAAVGSIDQVAVKNQVSTIMEGSAEAFRLRRERYGY